MIPLDIWKKISDLCSPWPRYCLALTCKDLLRHYRQQHLNSVRPPGHHSCGYRKGCDLLMADAIKFKDIRGYKFVAVCENHAGVDTEFQRRLLLLDDYWRHILPRCIHFRSLFDDVQKMTFPGTFPRNQYKPLIHAFGDYHPARAANLEDSYSGNFKCMWGKIFIDDVWDSRGFRDVMVDIIPTFTNGDDGNVFRLAIELHSCRI